MGQISQAFDHIKDNKEITELSAVLYADSFFCGFWSGSGILLKCESFGIDAFSDKIKEWNKLYPHSLIKIMSSCVPYIHLPQAYYDEEYFEDYFTGIYDLRRRKQHEKELDNFIHEEIHTLHYIGKEIIKELSSNDLSFKLSHISTAMANYSGLTGNNILVFMESQNLHIAFQKEGQFRFYNQFHCVDVNDYLYFILMVVQRYGDEHQNSEICLGGEIDRTSKLYMKLRSYFPNLQILDDELKTTEALESPSQVYFDLVLCKSCV